jgi:hypothetical protein
MQTIMKLRIKNVGTFSPFFDHLFIKSDHSLIAFEFCWKKFKLFKARFNASKMRQQRVENALKRVNFIKCTAA